MTREIIYERIINESVVRPRYFVKDTFGIKNVPGFLLDISIKQIPTDVVTLWRDMILLLYKKLASVYEITRNPGVLRCFSHKDISQKLD